MRFLQRIIDQIKTKILFRYLIAYFLVLILPFGIGCFYYTNTLDILEEKVINENNSYLKQATISLDQRLAEVAAISNQITSSQSVKKFQRIQKPFEYPKTYSALELRNTLSNYSPSNKFITNYFVFFHKSELVVNRQITYTYEDFYMHYLAPSKVFDTHHLDPTYDSYEQWRKQIDLVKRQQTLDVNLILPLKSMDGVDSPVGEYVLFCTPFYSYGIHDGFAAIVVNKEEIINLLGHDSNSSGFSYIENREKEVVFSTNENKEDIAQVQNAIKENSQQGDRFSQTDILGEKMIISSMHGENSGYSYVSVQPKEIVFSKANTQRQMLLGILLSSIILSIITSYILAKNSYKPFKQILASISAQNTQEDVFVAIKDSFSSLKKTNSALQNTLEKQLDILHDSFLSKIINRELTTPNEIQKMCEVLNFNNDKKVFALLMFQCDVNIQNYDAIDLTIVNSVIGLLKEEISSQLDRSYMFATSHQLVLLLCGDDEVKLKNQAKKIVLDLKQTCPKQIYEQLLISGSACVDDLENIPKCVEQANLAFKFSDDETNSDILWYKPVENKSVGYKFTAEKKNKLICFCKLGKEEEARKFMHDIFTDNLVDNSVTPTYQKVFIYELVSVIIAVLDSVEMQEEDKKLIYDEIESFEQKDALYQIKFIANTISQLCKLPKIVKLRSEMLNDILEYIDKNYADTNLSLTTIATKFTLNESYLSYMFKQQTNEKFFTYVEQMRIEKAKTQLRDTENSIAQIAQNVGYLSANSFCRAFKRVTGQTTTLYRNQQ